MHLFSPYGSGIVMVDGDYVTWSAPLWSLPFIFVGGVLLFFVMLHIVRGIGQLHGQLAKHLLVKAS